MSQYCIKEKIKEKSVTEPKKKEESELPLVSVSVSPYIPERTGVKKAKAPIILNM